MPYSDLQFEAMANVRPGPAARGNHALQSAVAATVSRSQNVVVIYWFIPLLLLAGILALLVLLGRSRRDADRIEEENQKFAQDRQRLFEFIHLMTEALGEGLTREELHQRIVHASILCTGALSACIFEQTDRGTLRGIAVEGLFPPHRPLTDALKSTLGTRAKFIEQVLKSEEFAVGEGIVGRVASSRRGEWLADAAADPRMVKHDDAALAVRSAIVVPLIFREKFFGVLAVANPAGESQFNEADFVLLQSLAEQAALALHNAEFLHLQMEKQQLDLDLFDRKRNPADAAAAGFPGNRWPRPGCAVCARAARGRRLL